MKPPDPTPLPPPQTEPVEMRQAQDDLISAFSNPVVYTALTDIPTVGAATYDGYFSAQLSNLNDDLPDELIANLNLEVRFNGAGVSLTGQATNFFDENNQSLSGSLSASAGVLDRTGNPNNDATFTAELAGRLTNTGGNSFDITSQLEGDFLGIQHDALGGAVFGRVDQNGSIQDIDGRFIAAR